MKSEWGIVNPGVNLSCVKQKFNDSVMTGLEAYLYTSTISFTLVCIITRVRIDRGTGTLPMILWKVAEPFYPLFSPIEIRFFFIQNILITISPVPQRSSSLPLFQLLSIRSYSLLTNQTHI